MHFHGNSNKQRIRRVSDFEVKFQYVQQLRERERVRDDFHPKLYMLQASKQANKSNTFLELHDIDFAIN